MKSVTQWSRDEMLRHLEETFDQAARQRPDLLEPYLIRIDGLDDAERTTIMREALAATFALRHPAIRDRAKRQDMMTETTGCEGL